VAVKQKTDAKSQNDLSLFKINDTKWNLLYISPSGIKRNYEVEFITGNVFRYNEENDITPNNDLWEQNGNIIYIYINDKYTIYKGHIISKNLIKGIAINATNSSWEFELIRQSN
jgi:hypothetical protein